MASEPDKKKIATLCWKKGSDAMNQQNWDYAIEMFVQAALMVPDNVLYRQSARGVECRKYNNNKTGARFSGAKLMTVKGRIKASRLKENWADVDAAAEEGLKINPWDGSLNGDMAEACDKRGYQECAVFGYRNALEADPENKQYLEALAILLELRSEYDQARACYERLYKLDPTNGHARSMMTSLDFKKVTDRGGYDAANTTQDVRQPGAAYDEADGKLSSSRSRMPQAQGADGPGMSLEADLERAIRKNPAEVANYTKLASFLLQEKRVKEAHAKLSEALQVSGGDPNVRELLEDCELELMRGNLGVAKELAQSQPENTAARQNAVALSQELLSREITILSCRTERYPANMQLKFDLGRRLMRAKKWPESIKLFQQASADTRLKGDVLVNLGKCFLQDRKRKLALSNLEKAVPEINLHDRPDLFCDCHYILGCLYEESGENAKAEHHFTEVLQVDYDFRDARVRLEKLQGSADDAESTVGVDDE